MNVQEVLQISRQRKTRIKEINKNKEKTEKLIEKIFDRAEHIEENEQIIKRA